VLLDTNLNNTRAQHVYEKLGFQKTGVRLNSWTDQLGRLQSAVDYELTPEYFVNYLGQTP
jgi:ribosomal protein S18 acetylase RimI-like enzyme